MRSVAWRLWILIITMVLIILSIFLLGSNLFFSGYYEAHKTTEFSNMIFKAADDLTKQKEPDISGIATVYNASILKLSPEGKVLYHQSDDKESVDFINEVVKKYSNIKDNNLRTSGIITHNRSQGGFSYAVARYNIDGKEGTILGITNPTNMDEIGKIMKNFIFYVSILVILISIVLAILFSQYFSQPIRKVTRAAEAMAKGDLNFKFDVKQKDEIGTLALAMKSLAESLKRADKLRKELIGNISHEFRTPLSLIKGYAETLRDITGSSTEKRDEQLNIIIKESDRLSILVNDMIDYSQIQSGYIAVNKEIIPICNIAYEIVENFKLVASTRGITLSCEYNSDLYIDADPKRITQAIINLLYNAINHTPSGGSVTVSLVDMDEMSRLVIKDTGPGIPPEEAKNIWLRFYRLPTQRSEVLGSGLGLAIVKGIFESHGFNYGVDTEPGKGCAFWFEAPLLHKENTTKESQLINS